MLLELYLDVFALLLPPSCGDPPVLCLLILSFSLTHISIIYYTNYL